MSKELILDAGVEGGGATIYRFRYVDGADGFFVEGSSMSFDENDDEHWHHWRSATVKSFEEALALFPGGEQLITLYPVRVHPDFRQAVWQELNRQKQTMDDEYAARLSRLEPEWRRITQNEGIL